MTISRFRTLAAAAAAATLLALAPATAASAHDGLESSSPAAEESLTADPGTVSLTFSDTLMLIGDSTDGFALQVTDPEGLHYESGCVTVAGTSMTTPVALGDAGGYVVVWQVVSSDGHPTSGQYEFDYEPTTLDGAADGLTDAPVCGEAWAGAPDGTPTPTADPSTPATDAAGGSTGDDDRTAPETAVPISSETGADVGAAALPWPVIVLIGLAGAGALAAIVVLVLRRQRGGYGE